MAIPEGYAECVEQFEENEALKLEKAIYGSVHAARQFFEKIQDSLIQQVSSQVKPIHAQYAKKTRQGSVSC